MIADPLSNNTKGAEQAGQTSWLRTDRSTDSRLDAPPRSYRYRCRYRARCSAEVGVCIRNGFVDTALDDQRKIRGAADCATCHKQENARSGRTGAAIETLENSVKAYRYDGVSLGALLNFLKQSGAPPGR